MWWRGRLGFWKWGMKGWLRILIRGEIMRERHEGTEGRRHGGGEEEVRMKKSEKNGGVSRRGFLRGTGMTAVGAAIMEGGLAEMAQARAEEARVVGPGAVG